MNFVVPSLIPPRLNISSRSFTNLSISSSRSPTSVSSIPSSPTSLQTLHYSPVETKPHPLLEHIPLVADFLEARDILSLSAATRKFRDLRTISTFQRHLKLNGWDVDAILRRAETAKNSKGRPWMILAQSAVHKGDIARLYEQLPKHGQKYLRADKKPGRRFFHTLVDVATEHVQNNFNSLTSLAAAHDLSLIRFVSNVHAHDWNTRYYQSFVIASYINLHPYQPNAEYDLEDLGNNFSCDTKGSLSRVAARANLLYAYGCAANTIEMTTPPTPTPSTTFDPPHVWTSHGNPLLGVQKALDKLKELTPVSGVYRKSGGMKMPYHINFGRRKGSRTKIPFIDRDQLTLIARVSDGQEKWEINGSFDLKTGLGKFKNTTGDIFYEFWATPWGLTGEKTFNEGKKLGHFVLHWI